MIVRRVIALSLVASVFVLAISLASFAFADQHQQASPIAYDQKYNTTDSTKSAIPVTLKANSPDYNLLTFAIVSGPAHGALGTITKNDTLSKITNNNIDPTSVKVTYTPQKDYVGDDSFTFKVNDGKVDSNIAKVSINVNSINGAVVLPSSSSSSAPNTTSSSSIITAPISNNNNSNTNKAHLGH